MRRSIFGAMLALTTAFAIGCGSSPRDAGKAFAEGVIASIDSGDPSTIQKAMEDAQAKTKGMSASDATEFMQGYQEVVMPWIQSKMP